MTPDVDPPIMIDSRWTAYQLNGFLRTKFPTLFQYFAAQDPSILDFNATSDPAYELPYALLVAEDGVLSVVPNCTNPDGARCRFNKGRESAGWKESAIYLGMCPNCVPGNGPCISMDAELTLVVGAQRLGTRY